MRRADRLFRLVQLLRRKRVTTARALAEALEVSERTVYRDIADLAASGVPVSGEAGVGYALQRGFDLPPLMFTELELEALLLGARVVQSWADAELAEAARAALARVEAALPERLQARLASSTIFAPSIHVPVEASRSLAPLRHAVAGRHIVTLTYVDKGDAHSERRVWPLGLFFWGRSWTVAAWCELRQDFRGFRLDRIHSLQVSEEQYPEMPGRTLEDFFRAVGAPPGGSRRI
ncbi:YafY family protein [Myxococcaceae bacterium GXIMD 01537]